MRSFSTPAVIFTVSQIDEEKGILHKVIVATAGKVKSYFEQIDSVTLHQIASWAMPKKMELRPVSDILICVVLLSVLYRSFPQLPG